MKGTRATPTNYPNHVEPPIPLPGRRLGGVHWWDPDRIRHLADLPVFCPSCGAAIVENGGISVEYWEGEERVYHTWCHGCGWAGDIIKVYRMIGHEAAE
jgi:hypothetical protein